MKLNVILLSVFISINSLVYSQIEDPNPPVLNWVTITPNSVKNNDTITVRLNATDDISGISEVGAYLGSPDNSLFQNLNGYFYSIGNHTYETKVIISNWAVSGQWFISSIFLQDSAGNSPSIDTIKYFTVNSTSPDNTSPTLNWITVTPGTVKNSDTITVQMNVTDDISGVSDVGAYMGSPDNILFQNLNGAFYKIGGNTYETKIKINKWAINGQWNISSINIGDSAGNTLTLDTIKYFTVNSTSPDNTSPVLNWITVTPNTVFNNDTITVQMNVTDEVSGVESVGAYLGSPENSLFQNLNGLFKYLGDNTYETKVKINNWAVSGQWYISFIYLLDSAGNSPQMDTIKYFTVINTNTDGTEIIKKSEIVVYPNPTTSLVHIQSDEPENNFEILLFDNTGKLLRDNKSKSKSIDLSDFAKGSYILQVKTGSKIINKQIIKY